MRLSVTDICDRGTKSLAPKSLFSLHVTGQRKEDKKAGRKTGVDMQLALVLALTRWTTPMSRRNNLKIIGYSL